MDAPQEVVGELGDVGLLERRHLAALRVHALEDVLDGAVLATGVDRLQHDEEGLVALGVEPALELGQPVPAAP